MNINKLLKEQLELIKPSDTEIKEINRETKDIIDNIHKNLKKKKIIAEIFVGGSSAKDTLIKKKKYDIDIFVRFDPKYDQSKISDMLKRALPKNVVKRKGSRNYYSLKKGDVEFEIIPVVRVKKPDAAQNITDLSYFHVKYVKSAIKKNKRLADEIRIAKAFTYYQDCYGAESYINGFSGYALELLIIHYKTFMNFLKRVVKIKDKEVIDSGKFFKNKKQALQEVNVSKLFSPIILIDPTYKERNALAALSPSTFKQFQKCAAGFLRNPSPKFFKLDDKEKILEKKYGDKLIKLEIKTKKQAGDIGGTKLKKFYRYFIPEIGKRFVVEKTDFDYNEKNNIGVVYLVVKPIKEVIYPGPPIKMKDALKKFKKEHKKIKVIKGRAFAYEKNNMSFESYIKKFKQDKKKILKEMSVSL